MKRLFFGKELQKTPFGMFILKLIVAKVTAKE